ncbi:MAG: methyltransferase domain-containing protein [Terriglobia bacterium]|jgi:SAM-dependent methyltransferase
MKPRLAELLVCPECSASLQLKIQDQNCGEIITGSFVCPACRQEFPIREGIPRFVRSDVYAASFSYEWKRWQRTQFDTESRRLSESTFVVSTGRRPRELAGKLALDVGCGTGRFMELLARAGAETVGMDLSQAVEVAAQNLRSLPNCHFLQADALRPPFRPGTFDFAYSIGVLHHTPNTRRAFLRTAETLKPQGEAAIWVYPKWRLVETFRYFPGQVNEVLAQDVNYRIPLKWQKLVSKVAPVLDWTTEASSRLQRFFTTRLPSRWLYALCHVAIPVYYLYRIPIFYPLRLLTKIAMHPDPEWRVLDTFDWYSPRYQWKHTYPEVQRWFEEAGFENLTRLPRPVAFRGKKSALKTIPSSHGASA